jgi:DNA polymerase-3 subunit delta
LPLRKLFIFLGPEAGEKDEALRQIRKNLGGGESGSSNFEETSFYAGENSVSDIVSSLENGSLFASSRLFLIKNAENISKKNDVELIAGALEKLPEASFVVLLSDQNHIDKRLEALPGADKRTFYEMFENRKQAWLQGFFRRQGFSITMDAVETILELVENNTEALGRECGRLVLFLDKTRPVESADIERWLSHSREESAFSLFSAIAAGDLEHSIDISHSLLLAGESPQGILAGLVWCFRRLRDYSALNDSAKSAGKPVNDFEYKKIGLAFPRARADYEKAYKRGLSAAQGLALLAQTDLETRSLGSGLQEVLMDRLVCRLAG